MDGFLEVTMTDWGITLDTAPLYFNISWGVIATAIGVIIARKIMKARRA